MRANKDLKIRIFVPPLPKPVKITIASMEGDISTDFVYLIKWYKSVTSDKVWMYEEMMTNDDDLESNLLTSSLLKIRSLYKFCYKLSQTSV